MAVDAPMITSVEIKEEAAESGDWANFGMENSSHTVTCESEEMEELNRQTVTKTFIEEERDMKKKEHEFKMKILNLKFENEMKESQEHDLRIESLKLDLELKRRQLKLFETKESPENSD